MKPNRLLKQLALTTGLMVFSMHSFAVEVTEKFNGMTINANLELVNDNDYSGPVVLLTHGTLTHSGRSTYKQLQNNLKAKGISSIAPNLSLGVDNRHGEYDCAVPHTHKHTDALNEIGFWLDWLKAKGAENITLMGHSRGGNQTAWFAHKNDSDKFQKVVLIAPATGGQQDHAEFEEKYGTSMSDLLKQANAKIAAGNGDELMKVKGFIYCKDTSASAAAIVDYYTIKPEFDTPTLLKSATKPTLVVTGDSDTVVADLPEKIAPLVDAGKIQTVEIADADHFFLDFASEDLAAEAADFINQ